MPITHIALFIVLLAAVLTDLSQQRIPNLLTFPAMLLGLALHGWAGGVDGLLLSGGGLALGLGVLLPFYLFGMMGAGDVKLMGAVGAFLGAAGVFQAFLFTALAGGIYGLAVLLWKGRLWGFFKRLGRSLYLSLAQRRPMFLPDENAEALPRLCYGLAIAVGTVLSLFLELPGFG